MGGKELSFLSQKLFHKKKIYVDLSEGVTWSLHSEKFYAENKSLIPL